MCLSVCLTLLSAVFNMTPDDLKTRVNNCTESNASDVLSQVQKLYTDYLIPSSHTYLPVENTIIIKLAEGIVSIEYKYLYICIRCYE